MKIAILLTCFNRKAKTEACLASLYRNLKSGDFDIYLVDDHSSDGTAEMVAGLFPEVKLVQGTGCLYWAGGMRLAWQTALKSQSKYDGYLLINDDVEFCDSFWEQLLATHQFALAHYSKSGIYVLSTRNKQGQYTYGGHRLRKSVFRHRYDIVIPSEVPQTCDLTNANILLVTQEVVRQIGILDAHFTHSLADFDYGLSAKEAGFPVLVAPGVGGYCEDDHHVPHETVLPLKARIKRLYSVKGIALNEYLYYLNKHFRFKAAYAFVVLWLKTLLPSYIK